MASIWVATIIENSVFYRRPPSFFLFHGFVSTAENVSSVEKFVFMSDEESERASVTYHSFYRNHLWSKATLGLSSLSLPTDFFLLLRRIATDDRVAHTPKSAALACQASATWSGTLVCSPLPSCWLYLRSSNDEADKTHIQSGAAKHSDPSSQRHTDEGMHTQPTVPPSGRTHFFLRMCSACVGKAMQLTGLTEPIQFKSIPIPTGEDRKANSHPVVGFMQWVTNAMHACGGVRHCLFVLGGFCLAIASMACDI
jgi:hypothetical protein